MTGSQFLAPLGVAVLTGTFAIAYTSLIEMSAATLGILTGLGAACLAAYLWKERPLEERRFVSLGAVFCIYYAISYGFSVLGSPPGFSERILPQGLNVVNLSAVPLGLLAWLGGYRFLHMKALSGGVRRLLLPTRTLRPVDPSTLLAFYATTVVARVALIVLGTGYGYLRDAQEAITSTSLLRYVSVYGEFGVIVLGLVVVASGHASKGAEGYRRAYLWMFPLELGLSLLVGQKSTFLLVVVMFVFALIAAGRLSYSPRKIVLVAIVALLVIFPLADNYREILRPGPGRQLPAGEAPGALVTAAEGTAQSIVEDPIDYAEYTFDRTVGRFREIDRAAVSIQAHDSGKPYAPATEMVERVATFLVPRILWPDKPLSIYGLKISREYYGVSSNVISASSLSPVGDAYRYGGLWMITVALALLGAYVRLMDDTFSARHSVWLVPLLIAAIPLLRSGDVAGLLVAAIRYYLIMGILYRFLFVRSARGATGRRVHRPFSAGGYPGPGR